MPWFELMNTRDCRPCRALEGHCPAGEVQTALHPAEAMALPDTPPALHAKSPTAVLALATVDRMSAEEAKLRTNAVVGVHAEKAQPICKARLDALIGKSSRFTPEGTRAEVAYWIMLHVVASM